MYFNFLSNRIQQFSVIGIAVEVIMLLFRSYVAFTEKQRFVGNSAKNQVITNIKNTVWGTKRLLARQFDDKQVQSELDRLPYTIVKQENGDVGIKVSIFNNHLRLEY